MIVCLRSRGNDGQKHEAVEKAAQTPILRASDFTATSQMVRNREHDTYNMTGVGDTTRAQGVVTLSTLSGCFVQRLWYFVRYVQMMCLLQC